MTRTLLDDAAAETIHAILASPALPVGTTAAGPDGERIAALREALDYVGSRWLVADETRQAESLAALATVDSGVADALRWHASLTVLPASLPAGRARNAALGGIRRGQPAEPGDLGPLLVLGRRPGTGRHKPARSRLGRIRD